MSAQKYYAEEFDRHPLLAVTPLTKHSRIMITATLSNQLSRDYSQRFWVEVEPKPGTSCELLRGLTPAVIRLCPGATWLNLIHELAHLDGVLLRGWSAERHDQIHALAVDKWAADLQRRRPAMFWSDFQRASEADPTRHPDLFSVET